MLRKKRFLSCCVLLACVACYGSVGNTASVKVKVEAPGMAEMEDALVEVSTTIQRYKCAFKENFYTCNDVPWGEYNLRISSAGFQIVDGPIKLYSSLIAVKVGLQVAGTHSTAINELRGELNTAAYGSEPLFLSLIPQYWGEGSTTTLIDSKGRFALGGFNNGQFVLVISNANKMLCSQLIELTGKKIASGKPTEGKCLLEIKDP